MAASALGTLAFALLLIAHAFTGSNAKNLPQSKAGCVFDLDASSPAWPPHLIDTNNGIVLPVLESGIRTITLDVGQQVTVACVGANSSVVNYLIATGLQLNPATCTADSMLLLDGVSYSYDQLGCLIQNHETLVEVGTCANGEGTTIRVGWQAGPDFIPLFDQCHDKVRALNYFSTNIVHGRSAEADDKKNDRPYYFSQDVYFPGIAVNTAYTQVQQTQTIAEIVGSDALAAQYINISANFYLARGHMAPDGDFIDAASQDASYYFMNTAPQYQSFNDGNWKWLEIGVRKEAVARDLKLTIYTGTFSVLTLADINGVQQPIYLAKDANNNGLIPAPKYYWKLIYDPLSNTATGVVGVNNPHLTSIAPADIFCPDVCDQVPWIAANIFQPHNFARGYTFCCTAADLHQAINFAPNLDVPLFV